VRHDDFFETVRPNAQNPETLSHQALAGFKETKLTKASEGAASPEVEPNLVIPRTETLLDNIPESFPNIDPLQE
jgi:hypothetical protein